MIKKKIPINYASRDFNALKEDLIQHTKRYYPETFKDFGDGSFGSIVLDAVAYVGDILSFYLDYQANETFLDTATERGNVIRLARQYGYRHNFAASSTGDILLYLMVPASSTGLSPDPDYIPVLKRGSTFVSRDGVSYFLLEDILFSDPTNDVVAARVDAVTGIPTHYAIKAVGRIMSGQFGREVVPFGEFQRFPAAVLSNDNIVEILAVIDSEGNEYFEVDNLSQNTIYREIPNPNSREDGVKSILKPYIAPRRFVVERDNGSTFLQFGYGSVEEIKTNSIADPGEVTLDITGKDYITSTSFDPSKLIQTDKFGIAPANTSLTIVYRMNSVGTVNARVGQIDAVLDATFEFEDPGVLQAGKANTVVDSLECYNEDPLVGDSSTPNSDEIRIRANDVFAAQNRAVTRLDYESMVYSMPSKFGTVKRCCLYRDPDSNRRNLNLYVISQNSDGTLQSLNTVAKQNIKTWISTRKMAADTIDILDAKIVNLGMNFTIISDGLVDKQSVFSNCIEKINEELRNPFFIGENFPISRFYGILNRVRGVSDVKNVVITKQSGDGYSGFQFDIESNISDDGRFLEAPRNVIFEIKFDSDIQGSII